MERTQLFDLMSELKLYGMKDAFDEVMATAVKRQHEPQRIITLSNTMGPKYLEAEVTDALLSASHLPAVACAPRWKTRAAPFSPGDNVPGGASPALNGGSADWRDLHLSVRAVFSGEVSLCRSVRPAATGAKLGSVRDHA